MKCLYIVMAIKYIIVARAVNAIDDLRADLVAYMKKKFATRRNIADMAEDIVNQAFLEVMRSHDQEDGRFNFGYMSVACIRTAYKVFHKNDSECSRMFSFELYTPLVDVDCFIDEIVRAEDTAAILQSLQTLKRVEQVIIRERYYGCYTFREISERHGINLNTVLSHHRRALGRLRNGLSLYFGHNND